MPNHFAIGRIEEWHAIVAKAELRLFQAFGIPFSLGKHVLGPECKFFCLNNSDYLTTDTQRVICGSGRSWILLDRTAVLRCKRFPVSVGHHFPARYLEHGID